MKRVITNKTKKQFFYSASTLLVHFYCRFFKITKTTLFVRSTKTRPKLEIKSSTPYFILQSLFLTKNIVAPYRHLCGRSCLTIPGIHFVSDTSFSKSGTESCPPIRKEGWFYVINIEICVPSLGPFQNVHPFHLQNEWRMTQMTILKMKITFDCLVCFDCKISWLSLCVDTLFLEVLPAIPENTYKKSS